VIDQRVDHSGDTSGQRKECAWNTSFAPTPVPGEGRPGSGRPGMGMFLQPAAHPEWAMYDRRQLLFRSTTTTFAGSTRPDGACVRGSEAKASGLSRSSGRPDGPRRAGQVAEDENGHRRQAAAAQAGMSVRAARKWQRNRPRLSPGSP